MKDPVRYISFNNSNNSFTNVDNQLINFLGIQFLIYNFF